MSGKLTAGFKATRPETLCASIAPISIGIAMAYGDGVGHLWSAVLAMAGGVLIHVGTNLTNDYCDFKKGADQINPVGPERMMQSGILSERDYLWGIFISFFLACAAGVYLINRGGWPVLLIGVLSILSGILYTAGPWALGYSGLGDIFVLIFFGPVSVCGTYYVQALEFSWATLPAGIGIGLMPVAILAVNNVRDRDSDIIVNKKTLVVRFGRGFGRFEYMFSLVIAGLLPILIYFFGGKEHWLSMATVIIPLAGISSIKKIFQLSNSIELNGVLETTAKLTMLYSVLFSIGWLF